MSYSSLSASNGNGDAVLMHIESPRLVGGTSFVVDTTVNVPTSFIATAGSLTAAGYIDPATKMEFEGHLSGGNVVIDALEPGSVDNGNTEGQVIVIRPTTGWANRVAGFIKNATGLGTPGPLTASSVTASNVVLGGETFSFFIPKGAVMPYAGSSAPTGWLLAQGQLVSRTTYAALFAIIGTSYGAGDGSTTFALPDLRSNIPVGYKSGDSNFGTLGQTGGEKTHILTATEMPSHNHGFRGHATNAASVPYTGSESWVVAGGSFEGPASFIDNNGSDGAHNNLQPYVTLNYIIKV